MLSHFSLHEGVAAADEDMLIASMGLASSPVFFFFPKPHGKHVGPIPVKVLGSGCEVAHWHRNGMLLIKIRFCWKLE